ncbi:MAG: hypothetical protein ACYC4U_02900 [Pirellulaceae bacterium]
MKIVVERYTANILRDARAAKRDRRETCSLSMIVDEDEYGLVELSETIGWLTARGPIRPFTPRCTQRLYDVC